VRTAPLCGPCAPSPASTSRDVRRPAGSSPGYDLLLVDADQLTLRELRRRPALEDVVAAGRWIAAFDLHPRALDALRTYTGFDVADGEHGDRSEMFLFRVAKVEGTSAGGSPRGTGATPAAPLPP